MRNWNYYPPTFYLIPSSIYILPMRNWNEFYKQLTSEEIEIYILPMRNWNLNAVVGDFQVMRIYILPMRNWNQGQQINGRQNTLGFTFYLWGIETTNNRSTSSKDSFIYILPMRNWNSISQFIKTACIEIYILPMRNWNAKSKEIACNSVMYLHSTYEELKHWNSNSRNGRRIRFTFYLWGIETTYIMQ